MRRVYFAALVVTAMLIACAPSQPANAPTSAGFDPVGNLPDVTASNLSPADEIGALLKGKAAFGRAKSNLRVAVPPFKVRTAQASASKENLGLISAELVTSRLSHAPGISVLERGELTRIIEETKKNQDVDTDTAKPLAATGKLLGAKVLILGTLLDLGSDRFRTVLRPVRVEDAVMLPSVEFDVTLQEVDRGVGDAVDRLLASIGSASGAVVPTGKPLGRAQLELATRARELQYQGKLTEAQPLYDQALGDGSNAWRLEADYIRLMLDLGMQDWAAARATKTLAQMPQTGATVCDRARIAIERVRAETGLPGEEWVDDARDAVRLAASCGDKTTVAWALVTYFYALEGVHAPSAKYALTQALALVRGESRSAWLECWVSHELYRASVDEDRDWQGTREDHWRAIAESCERVGNLRLASLAWGNAGLHAWHPQKRDAYYDKAVEIARAVGGSRLDAALFGNADNLRGIGRPSEADAMLLDVLGARAKSLVAIWGALPDEEARLDDELLRRMGVARGGAKRQLRPEEELLARAHRKALASALRQWAARTDNESKPQADAYRAVAGAIERAVDPSTPPTEEDPDKALEQRFARAKLPYKALLSANAGPLRNSGARPADAFAAAYTMFWDLYGKKPQAPIAALRDAAAVLRKLATWSESTRLSWSTALAEAKVYQREGNVAAAVERLRAANAGVKDDPAWVRLLIDHEAELAGSDKAHTAELRKTQIDLAKRTSPNDWVSWTYYSAYASWVNGEDFHVGLDALAALAQDLEQQQAWEAAGLAHYWAAWFERYGEHVDGSSFAVSQFRRRAEVLDKLGDPLRSVDARVDVLDQIGARIYHSYRQQRAQVMKTDADARAVRDDVFARLKKFADEKRLRDAARVAARVPDDIPGALELLNQALDWTNAFKDSAEYPRLAAKVHFALGFAVETHADKRRELLLARDLYAQAKDTRQATMVGQKLISESENEAELWQEVTKCFDIAGAAASNRDDCVEGVGIYILDKKGRPTDKAQLKKALATGIEILGEMDRVYSPDDGMRYRRILAAIAAWANDLTTFDRFVDEIRAYYTQKEPNAYRWASECDALGRVVATADPKRAIAILREFDRSGGASDFWKGSEYYLFADIARKGGDKEAEAFFQTRGRTYAMQSAPKWAFDYDLYEARAAVGAKDWRSAAASLKKTVETVDRFSNNPFVLRKVMVVARAVAHAMARDYTGAAVVLGKDVDATAKRVEAGEPTQSPCIDAHMLEVAAATAYARGVCAEGKRLRDLAAKASAACVKVTCDDTWCEGPTGTADGTKFRDNNACGQPASFTTEMFP